MPSVNPANRPPSGSCLAIAYPSAAIKDRPPPVPSTLSNRHRFTAHERLVDDDVACLHDHRIGRDAISLAEHDQIVFDQLSPGDSKTPPVANDERARARQIAQCGERAPSLSFLKQGQGHDENHEAKQHRRFLAIPDGSVDPSAHEQKQRHWLAQQREDVRKQSALPSGWELVETALRAAFGDLI